jgi:hypothetical protein
MSPVVRRTWAPRGKTPIIQQRGRGWQKVSAIAALTVPPRRKRVGLYFSLFSDANITAARVIRFLRQLYRHLQKPVIIVWDRSNTHRAKSVRRFFDRRPSFQQECFPAYAPHLNPVEMLWGYLKGNPMANFAPMDVETLSRTTRYHATKVGKRKALLRSFLYATPLFSRPK